MFNRRLLLIACFVCLASFAITSFRPKRLQPSPVRKTKTAPDVFFNVIAQGRLKRVQKLLSKRYLGKENIRNSSGWTGLHVAAFYGKFSIAKVLLHNFPQLELNPLTAVGESPLHFAAQNGHYKIVEMLLQQAKRNGGAEIVSSLVGTETKHRKWTPLFYLANSTLEKATFLSRTFDILVRKFNSSLSHRDNNHQLAVHVALSNRRLDLVKLFLKHKPDLAKSKCGDAVGKTMSHLVAEWNYVDFLDQLAPFFHPLEVDGLGLNPLCYAAQHGSVQFGRKLYMLNIVYDVGNCVFHDFRGFKVLGSPKHAAVFHRKKLYLEFMLLTSNKAQTDSTGGSPLHTLAYSPKENLVHDEASDLVDIVTLLLRDGTLLESTDYEGCTPFLVAIKSHFLRLAHILVYAGANVLAVDKRGYSALHLATTVQQVQFVMSLQKISPDAKTSRYEKQLTPLNLAITQRKSLELINYLVRLKADTMQQDGQGRSIAHLAVEFDSMEALDAMLDGAFGNISAVFRLRDQSGWTPLVAAIVMNKTEAALKMIRSESNFPLSVLTEDRVNEWNDTLLHLAVAVNRAKVVEALLHRNNGELANIANGRDESAFHLAIRFGTSEAPRAFIKALSPSQLRSVLNAKNLQGRTAVAELAVYCRTHISELLLPYLKFSENITDKYDKTPLEIAVENNCIELVPLLLSQGYDCSRPSPSEGLTPLHYATKHGLDYLFEQMLKSGKCSTSQVDSCGVSVDVKEPGRCLTPPIVAKAFLERYPRYSCSGSILRFNCLPGFVLRGSNEMTCLRNGDWKLKGGFCDNSCPALEEDKNYCVADGQISSSIPSNNTIGSLRSIICSDGFTLIGPKNAMCAADGEWRIANETRCLNNKVLRETQQMLANAIDKRDINAVRELLSLGYLEVNWRDPSEREESTEKMAHYTKIWCFGVRNATLLHLALRCNHMEKTGPQSQVTQIVKWLLDLGVDVNVKEPHWNYTPLHMASAFGHYESARHILDRGGDKTVNDKAKNDWTTIHFAAGYGHLPTLELLLERGGLKSINETGVDGYSPLMLAAERQYGDTARLLLDKGASVQGCRWWPCTS